MGVHGHGGGGHPLENCCDEELGAGLGNIEAKAERRTFHYCRSRETNVPRGLQVEDR